MIKRPYDDMIASLMLYIKELEYNSFYEYLFSYDLMYNEGVSFFDIIEAGVADEDTNHPYKDACEVLASMEG